MTEDPHNQNSIRRTIAPTRTGVIICQCGGQISTILDTAALSEKAANIPGVIYTSCEAFPCSKGGLERLHQAIEKHQLERVLICGCAPRLVEKLFREAGVRAGLEPLYLDVLGIREQCVYVHMDDPDAAFGKALNLIKMGVARLAAISLPQSVSKSIRRSVVVIGSDLGGLAVALALADENIEVTIVEEANELGVSPRYLHEYTDELLDNRIEAVSNHPHIQTLQNASIMNIAGASGEYVITVSQGDQLKEFSAGAIIVATGVEPKSLDTRHWFDRARVTTQAEFGSELSRIERTNQGFPHNNIVMVLCAEALEDERCSRLCCLAGIRQAIRTKNLAPDTNVTILFRNLYLGANAGGEEEIIEAKRLGVSFFRYQKNFPPMITDKTVDVFDTLTSQTMKIPFDRAVLAVPLVPEAKADRLAAMLKLNQDMHGFLIEERVRLRPERYANNGIFVLSGAHQPSDRNETLFQAYITCSRALRFLNQEEIVVQSPTAQIDPTLCTGCANCVPICPTTAIRLMKREGLLSLAEVDFLRCIGCGNCAVICPVKAISLPSWDDLAILSQIDAALESDLSPKDEPIKTKTTILVFACEWSAYAAADMAGARKIPYPSRTRIIRLNCSARLDPYHILWAFLNGADGVLLGACPKGECHYGASNLLAEERIKVLKSQLDEYGVDPQRLHIEFLSGDDGAGFAEAIMKFTARISKRRPDAPDHHIQLQNIPENPQRFPEKRG